MDSDSFASISSEKMRSRSRAPLREVRSTVYFPPLRTSSLPNPPSRQSSGDRFIPDRSAMDFDFAHFQLTESRREKENTTAPSPAKEAYRKLLAETLLNNRTRILAFKSKPQVPNDGFLSESSQTVSHPTKTAKQRRYISQTAERTLDAPDILDDYYLNLLDWGSSNVLSIALGNTVYLWNASEGSTSELVTIDADMGPVTSVSWAPDGHHIAVGLNNSHVQLWDSNNSRLLRTLKGVHRSRVGSLSWNNNILTTGGMDGKIVNNDVRIRSHAILTYRGHTQEVCGLKWSGSGQHLASGGNDNLLHIWDLSMSSSSSNPRPSQNQWLHRFDDHLAAVKALSWCPFQSNLLASGGGGNDRCIKFWNTHTGACLNSVDTGSQVCSLLWNRNERELLSSHGFTQNQLTLWKYPSMVKMAELNGHTSRVLFMAQSPDGCTVASAAGDETLRFWNVFGTPQVAAKPAPNPGPFSSYNHISPDTYVRKQAAPAWRSGVGVKFQTDVDAYGYTVYLWNASEGSTSELVTMDADMGPVTSVSWAPNGHHIAVGLNNSHVQLWDSNNSRLLRTLNGVHRSRVGSLSWNSNILTTGGMDGKIVNNDVRIRSHTEGACSHEFTQNILISFGTRTRVRVLTGLLRTN